VPDAVAATVDEGKPARLPKNPRESGNFIITKAMPRGVAFLFAFEEHRRNNRKDGGGKPEPVEPIPRRPETTQFVAKMQAMQKIKGGTHHDQSHRHRS
jgi:hypothetical protein